MTKQQLIAAFLNAVSTWKAYIVANRKANKRNDQAAKKYLSKAVFYWVKECERLKKMLDFALFSR